MTFDANNAVKVFHLAAETSAKGTSALCFTRKDAINLRIASWTTDEARVTCKRCRRIIAQSSKSAEIHTGEGTN